MRPEYLAELGYEMGQVYAAITDRILINLSKYFSYIKDSRQIRGGWEYQARMLAKVGQVNRETVDIIAKSLGGGDAALRRTIETAIVDALRNEEPRLRRAAQAGMLNGGILPPALEPGMMQAFNAYYRQSADKLNLVNTVMLESTEAAYRATVADVAQKVATVQRTINAAAGEAISGVSSYNAAVHDAVKKLVTNGITGFIDHGGHRWSPEAYVTMDVRTTLMNTARAAVFERNEQYSNDLYQVSSHSGARPLCYPWQLKVISNIDAARDVTDLYGNTIHVYAQSETTYGQAAGLFGVNCKHYPIPFIPGVSDIKGEEQPPEENAKTYAESQQQRALERKLREEKRDLEVMKAQGASPEQIDAQKKRVAKASSEIDDFCDETGRARRRNREYTPVNATWPEDY